MEVADGGPSTHHVGCLPTATRLHAPKSATAEAPQAMPTMAPVPRLLELEDAGAGGAGNPWPCPSEGLRGTGLGGLEGGAPPPVGNSTLLSRCTTAPVCVLRSVVLRVELLPPLCSTSWPPLEATETGPTSVWIVCPL